MIEFNLLPDVKLEFVKTRRVKRLVTVVAVLVAAFTLTILVFLIIFVDILQKKNMSDINRDIHTTSAQLQGITDLNKVLTIQNQLLALPGLHSKKPVASRLFNYMTAVTPAQATIANLNVDFIQHTFTITGQADSLSTVNRFTDTLKFTTYSTTSSSATSSAFSNVVLSSFGRKDNTAAYTILLSFDPTIFDEASTVTLTVPKITSTRSITEKPTDLFKQSSTTTP